MNLKSILPVVLALGFGVIGHAAQVSVFAAASLSDSLKQIAADYQKSSGDEIVFNFAGSGVLARQIEAGAPADIFFSADQTQMDAVAAKDLLIPETRTNLLSNALVIVVPTGDALIHSPADLTHSVVHRVALGEVKTVPAGSYAREYLEKIGCWPAVEPKVVACENVRAVLAVVESGNADAGIVYKTDAAISKKVKVAFDVPAADGPKITYPIALVKDSVHAEAARKFLAYLQSEGATTVFQRYGFIVSSSR